MPAEWLSAVGLGSFAPVGAELSYDATLSGTGGSPRLEGMLELVRGRFGPMVIDSVRGVTALSTDSVVFKELEATTDSGGARGFSGEVRFGEEITLKAAGEAVLTAVSTSPVCGR